MIARSGFSRSSSALSSRYLSHGWADRKYCSTFSTVGFSSAPGAISFSTGSRMYVRASRSISLLIVAETNIVWWWRLTGDEDLPA